MVNGESGVLNQFNSILRQNRNDWMKVILLDNTDSSEIATYKRKKDSNISKSSRKSKHKHIYKQVLLRTTNKFNGKQIEIIHLGRICTVCNKKHIDKYFITKKTDNGTYLVLENDEILKMYADLEIIDTEDKW